MIEFNNTLKSSLSLLTLFILLLGFTACQDDEENANESQLGTSELNIRLTDAPGDFDEVNIHIEQVRVNLANSGWQDLPTDTGIYDLLDFTNGIDTTIASGSLPSGSINQIRFVLGDSNSVLVDGVLHPLTIPSGYTSGLKLNVSKALQPELTYSILVDFDAAQSIVLTGNGQYKLKPVLKVIAEGKDAAIVGDLNPSNVTTMLYAVQNQDTLGGAISDTSGVFTINGLDAGTYSLILDPASPYKRDTITNINLTTGMVEDIGTITLNQ